VTAKDPAIASAFHADGRKKKQGKMHSLAFQKLPRMQIKTTLRFHLTPVRIAIVVLARMQRQRNPLTLLVGM
jgi:hypothetical protein